MFLTKQVCKKDNFTVILNKLQKKNSFGVDRPFLLHKHLFAFRAVSFCVRVIIIVERGFCYYLVLI